jgi:membrane dipeptidase
MAGQQPILVIDGHNDTLLQVNLPGRRPSRSFFEKSPEGHLDLPRAREGGLGGGFFAIYTPSPRPPGRQGRGDGPPALSPPVDYAVALPHTLALAARLFQIEEQSAGGAKVVRNVAELEQCLRAGVLAMIFHIEGAEAIDPQLDALEVLYQAGLRSIGITWSRANAFATGVPFQFPLSPNVGPGLTRAGRRLVEACNRLGVLIDLSHLNEKGFWDVAKLSQAPLVATHSGVHALCASARNLTDRQLDAIGRSGGLIGVNFHVGFLRADGRRDPDTPLQEIVRHVDYIAKRVGIDHVALGSDFDGATMPNELGDVSGLPKLLAALRSQGYDDSALRKIAYENWLRVLGQTWR